MDEYTTNQETLYHLVLGLIRRCRRKIYLGLSELNEQGNDQVGPLLKAVNQAISAPRSVREGEEEDDAEGYYV